MYKFFLLALLIASSCGTSKETSEETTSTTTSEVVTSAQNSTITLKLDEKIMIGDLAVHFKEVLEDSRCPTGVNCVWMGRAKVLVETSEDGMTVDRSEIIFGKTKNGETKNHNFYKSGRTTITATAINPYPTSEMGVTKPPYQLVLKVVKK